MLESLKRRSVLNILTCVSALAFLCGCSHKEETGATAAATAPAAATAATGGPLKIGFVHAGSVGDTGWAYAHDLGRKAMEAQFGDRIKTTFVENVAEGADAELVFRDLAAQGNTLIFGTSSGYMDAMLKVAKDFPKVRFQQAGGYKTAENLSVYDARTDEGAYLAGVVAGKMSRSGILGVVASMPISKVIRNIDAFTLGAQSSNPKITTKVVWINKWFDPAKEREGALALIAQGADVLIQNTDSPATLQAAGEKGVYAFGWNSDMSKLAPKAHLASVTIKWAPYYSKVVTSALAGALKAEDTWLGVKEGAIVMTGVNPELPPEVSALLDQKTAAIRAGKLTPFQGPVVDQSGKKMLSAGKTMEVSDLRSLNYYVKGVEGTIPK